MRTRTQRVVPGVSRQVWIAVGKLNQGLNFYRATILDCSAQDENLFRHRKSNQHNIVLQRAAILSPRVRSANENEFSWALGNFDGQFCCRCRAGRIRPGFLNVFSQRETQLTNRLSIGRDKRAFGIRVNLCSAAQMHSASGRMQQAGSLCSPEKETAATASSHRRSIP